MLGFSSRFTYPHVIIILTVPVESLYSLNVVPVQGDVLLVAPVEGGHQRAPLVGVRQAEGVTELVRGCHEEAGAPGSVHCPVLLVIEVDVTAVHWEKRVSQSSSESVEGIIIPVTLRLKP